MELFGYSLVVISAFTHAYWNFLLKRTGGSQIFIGLSKLSEVILFAPAFVWIVSSQEGRFWNYWHLFIIAGLLATLYYGFLGLAYRTGNLSVVYPISRASGLLFLPGLAFFLIGERVDAFGAVALGLITLGIFSLQLPAFSKTDVITAFSGFRSQATLFALLTGLTIAGYSLWDKNSLKFLTPFVYFYAYNSVVGILYAIFVWVRYPHTDIRDEWQIHKKPMVLVGILNTFTYTLVLFSLSISKASYVVALRQLGIAVGAVLGWKLLGEVFPVPKRVGIVMLLLGCGFIYLAQ
jgi:uncharacterized membrane protein